MTFNAPRAGTFHAVLKITLRDETWPKNQEFSVTRELRARAILAGGASSSGGPSNGNTTGSEGNGIIVSHDFGLQFSVERSGSDEPFTTQAEGLAIVITKSSVNPLVSFKASRISSSDDSVDM